MISNERSVSSIDSTDTDSCYSSARRINDDRSNEKSRKSGVCEPRGKVNFEF